MVTIWKYFMNVLLCLIHCVVLFSRCSSPWQCPRWPRDHIDNQQWSCLTEPWHTTPESESYQYSSIVKDYIKNYGWLLQAAPPSPTHFIQFNALRRGKHGHSYFKLIFSHCGGLIWTFIWKLVLFIEDNNMSTLKAIANKLERILKNFSLKLFSSPLIHVWDSWHSEQTLDYTRPNTRYLYISEPEDNS